LRGTAHIDWSLDTPSQRNNPYSTAPCTSHNVHVRVPHSLKRELSNVLCWRSRYTYQQIYVEVWRYVRAVEGVQRVLALLRCLEVALSKTPFANKSHHSTHCNHLLIGRTHFSSVHQQRWLLPSMASEQKGTTYKSDSSIWREPASQEVFYSRSAGAEHSLLLAVALLDFLTGS